MTIVCLTKESRRSADWCLIGKVQSRVIIPCRTRRAARVYFEERNKVELICQLQSAIGGGQDEDVNRGEASNPCDGCQHVKPEDDRQYPSRGCGHKLWSNCWRFGWRCFCCSNSGRLDNRGWRIALLERLIGVVC